MNRSELIDEINWDATLAAEKYAGGHEEVMRAIFEGRADVVAFWIEDSYDGEEAFAYLFPDGSVVIVTDYFGSCSGCDMWDDNPSESEIRVAIGAIVRAARIFDDLDAAIEFCKSETVRAEHFPMRAAKHLTGQLESIA